MEPLNKEILISKILNKLDCSSFTRHGFDCLFNKDDELVRIEFKENPNYLFIISRSANGFSSVESPGMHFVKADSYHSQNLEDVINRINGWTERIIEEISVSKKSNDVFGKLRQKLNKAFEQYSCQERPFDENESQPRREALDNLVTQFEELKESNKIRQAEFDLIRKEVDILKENIATVPKAIWIKIFGDKMINIMEDFSSNVGLTLVENTTSALLKGDGNS